MNKIKTKRINAFLPMLLLCCTAFGASCLISTPCFADTVHLINGRAIDGVVIGRQDDIVVLLIGNLGKMKIPEKEIESIEKNARTGFVDPNLGKTTEKDKKQLQGVSEEESESEGKSESGKKEKAKAKAKAEEKELDASTKKKVKEWVKLLTKDDTRKRSRAERRLRQVGPGALSYILPAAHHPSDYTRNSVYRILKEIGTHEVLATCIEGLEDDNRWVRKSASETLRKVSGRNIRFPWDDSGTDAQRNRAIKKWKKWLEKENRRREREREAKEALEEQEAEEES